MSETHECLRVSLCVHLCVFVCVFVCAFVCVFVCVCLHGLIWALRKRKQIFL